MNTDQMKKELQALLEETTSVLGGTDETYISLLKMLNRADKLSIPNRLYQGQLVFFKYKPQTDSFTKSNTYYDRYPLVLVTESYRGGFSGINVHYLDSQRRKILFDVIMRNLPVIKAGEEWRNRLMVDYDRLEARRQFKYFKPCYKNYVWKGVRRRPVIIPFEIWENMVASNTMRFEKAKPVRIFRDSYKKVIKQR